MLEQSRSLDVLVTGGAGFIGSNFLRHVVKKYPQHSFINLDASTYSGRLESISDLEEHNNYLFVHGNIRDQKTVYELIEDGSIVINFAAESHIDNSIKDSRPFIDSKVIGTHNLLETARRNNAALFFQISTDEVYGSLDFTSPSSTESDLVKPSSPYSASKAAAEMLCFGNMRTFKQPIIITRSSNNFGPYQFPEKVIPLFLTNLMRGKKVPLYGEGKNVRDWIYVEDNCAAIETVINRGAPGQVYSIGGGNEFTNLELTNFILFQMGYNEDMIQRVEDRLGHNLRCSLNFSKIRTLGWSPNFDFKESMQRTIDWYKRNEAWWAQLKDKSEKRTS